MMFVLILSLLLASTFVEHSLAFPHQQQHRCSSFAYESTLKGSNATYLNATYYPQHSLNVSNTFNDIAFCEIYGSVAYGSNDSLNFALWLPDNSKYHSRFLAVGNGGMAGIIDYAGMLSQINSGMGVAVAGGNAGHLFSDNNNGGGAPGVYLPYLHDRAQVEAWIHDAISLFTPAAKAWTKAYYGREPQHSYYYGCSTGGAQGFALAQLHPGLFDGIFAGSPGNWYSHLALSFLWNAQHTNVCPPNVLQIERADRSVDNCVQSHPGRVELHYQRSARCL